MRRCRIESLGVSLPRRTLFSKGALSHAVTAGRDCLKASRYNPNDVRLLINAGVYRDGHVCEPAIAAYIQHRLGINIEFHGKRTLAFDLLNGGCGLLNAMHVISSMIAAGEIEVGMAVSSEANSDRKPDPSYPYPASGAAALLDVSPKKNIGFGAFSFHTDERQAELFASRVSLTIKHGKLTLSRHADLEAAYLEGAKHAVNQVLEHDKLRALEVDWVVPAQISSDFLKHLPDAIGIPRDRVVDLSATLPDTHSTSFLLALQHTMKEALLTSGKKVLFLACGSGVTVGAASYQF
jgi:3-oxoacyl-[acyl-carrier-protein] synthase-3